MKGIVNTQKIFPLVLKFLLFYSSPKGKLIDYRERGREGEKHHVREKHPLAASHTHPTGDKPSSSACALTRNRVGDLSTSGQRSSLWSHTGQGRFAG